MVSSAGNQAEHTADPGDAVARLARSERILLLGPSGAGKTDLALQLAEILQLPVLHLDAHFWRPGWRPTPQAEWRVVVEQLVRRPRWIMDGTYESTLDLRVPAADSIVLLESPRLVRLWRVFQRVVLRRIDQRPDAPAGERFDRAFVRYIWRYELDTKPMVERCLAEHGAGKPLIILRTSGDASRVLRDLRRCCPPLPRQAHA